MKKPSLLFVLLVMMAGGILSQQFGWHSEEIQRIPLGRPQAPLSAETEAGAGADIIARAFAEQQSDVQVAGSGRVKRTLPDDNKGSRHQRFILELDNGHTVLVAHNIDLAPRIPRLQRGERVGFYGEYEYNPQGGVIHWTHRDPAGRHAHGWLEHQGKRFQ